MKKTTKLKALALSVMMMAGMFMPSAKAQNDSFLPDMDMGNRDYAVTWAATSQNFGQDAPLGTGLLIMLGAGAGYAFLKKKEEKI